MSLGHARAAVLLACLWPGLLAGCQSGDFESRADGYDVMAALRGNPDWRVVTHDDPALPSVTARRRGTHAKSVWVYIEGDGYAWLSRHKRSEDPTPKDPVALRMALTPSDTGSDAGVIYLGRPCQFVATRVAACDPKWWSTARYGSAVIDALDKALTAALTDTPEARLTLVGYSGGGPVAALLAARRRDVERLITVAANLDLAAWTRFHAVTPLADSIDPATRVDEIGRVAQVHFAGSRDTVVPPAIVHSFVAQLPTPHHAHVIEEAAFDHHCCWAVSWPRLRRDALQALTP